MIQTRQIAPHVLIAILALLGLVWAQGTGFDEESVILTYHKITSEPLDLRVVAERSEAARRASNFDRPDAVKGETARLEGLLSTADPNREFVITVSDSISQYDHDRGEFSISLFMPGYHVPMQSFGQQYQLVFANADGVRAIPMPKEEARVFDARLNQLGRQVSNEIHFRVIGKGDPAGGVVGARVVRAEVTSARLLDRAGNAVFTPNVTPFQSAKAAGGPAFDVTQADVAGFRVGVKAKDLEGTLARLFGPPQRSKPNRTDWFASKLAVNETGCMSMFGQDRSKVGAVCVTALLDADDIVRSIRVERVFPWFDSEVFRKSLVQKYGAVASAVNRGSAFVLGWGPDLDPRLGYSQSAPHNALTAHYVTNTDFASRGGNALPQMRIVLNLVDAHWASGRKQ